MCRKRHQAYSTSATNGPIYYANTNNSRRTARRKDCCSKRAAKRAAYYDTPTTIIIPHEQSYQSYAISNTGAHPSDRAFPIQNPYHQPQNHQCCGNRRGKGRRKGPIATMASLLLAGIGLGATKIQEKREQKKAKKKAAEWEEEQNFEEKRRSLLRDAEERRVSKSEEAELEATGLAAERRPSQSGGGSGSGSGGSVGQEGRATLPPPSYDDVLEQTQGRGSTDLHR